MNDAEAKVRLALEGLMCPAADDPGQLRLLKVLQTREGGDS